jgi:hypothetical protein
MKNLIIENKKKREDRNALILVTSSMILTLLLFFIDEGYYNFKWMTDIFNWLLFLIYFFFFLFCQVITYNLLPQKIIGVDKITFSVLLGIGIGLTFLILYGIINKNS